MGSYNAIFCCNAKEEAWGQETCWRTLNYGQRKRKGPENKLFLTGHFAQFIKGNKRGRVQNLQSKTVTRRNYSNLQKTFLKIRRNRACLSRARAIQRESFLWRNALVSHSYLSQLSTLKHLPLPPPLPPPLSLLICLDMRAARRRRPVLFGGVEEVGIRELGLLPAKFF